MLLFLVFLKWLIILLSLSGEITSSSLFAYFQKMIHVYWKVNGQSQKMHSGCCSSFRRYEWVNREWPIRNREIITLTWCSSYRVLQICTPGTVLYTTMYPFFGHCRNTYPASVRMYPAFSSIGIGIAWHNFQLHYVWETISLVYYIFFTTVWNETEVFLFFRVNI